MNLIKNSRKDTFSDTLMKMNRDSGMTETDAYKKTGVDRRHFSKIRNDVNYIPGKKTVILFIIALHLSIQQAEQLLESAGYAFSSSSELDLIIKRFVEQKKYDLFEINEILDMLDLETL